MADKKSNLDEEIARISELKEISPEWTPEDRLQVCRTIALEMLNSDDCTGITKWGERLFAITTETPEFIRSNQDFIVAGYGKVNYG